MFGMRTRHLNRLQNNFSPASFDHQHKLNLLHMRAGAAAAGTFNSPPHPLFHIAYSVFSISFFFIFAYLKKKIIFDRICRSEILTLSSSTSNMKTLGARAVQLSLDLRLVVITAAQLVQTAGHNML